MDEIIELKKEPGKKFDADKLRVDLVSLIGFIGQSRVYTVGSLKYSDRNWEKGMSWSRPYAATLRHLILWFLGEEYDVGKDGTRERHLDCAATELSFLQHFTMLGTGTDDRPKLTKEEKRKVIKWFKKEIKKFEKKDI
jgi:hypothetical protein